MVREDSTSVSYFDENTLIRVNRSFSRLLLLSNHYSFFAILHPYLLYHLVQLFLFFFLLLILFICTQPGIHPHLLILTMIDSRHAYANKTQYLPLVKQGICQGLHKRGRRLKYDIFIIGRLLQSCLPGMALKSSGLYLHKTGSPKNIIFPQAFSNFQTQ